VSFPSAWQLPLDVPADAGFLTDKATLFEETIKLTRCTTTFVPNSVKEFSKMIEKGYVYTNRYHGELVSLTTVHKECKASRTYRVIEKDGRDLKPL